MQRSACRIQAQCRKMTSLSIILQKKHRRLGVLARKMQTYVPAGGYFFTLQRKSRTCAGFQIVLIGSVQLIHRADQNPRNDQGK